MNTDPKEKDTEDLSDSESRREMLEKFGRFAAYAAPFTVLALAKKADAATGTGPGKRH